MIQLKDALQQMNARDHHRRPVPFHVQFVTCDEHHPEGGGRIIDMENVVLARSLSGGHAPASTSGAARAANEWSNATRNFFCIDSKQTRKASIRLITGFNHQPILP